jgi:hypothetical protein
VLVLVLLLLLPLALQPLVSFGFLKHVYPSLSSQRQFFV